MTLAPYVRILGRGPGRSRALTLSEAFEAMTLILNGDAAPEATGALLMLLRMKGETAQELAGFVQAARQSMDWTGVHPVLDWPSYAAGRTRGLPWFLLSAKLVAQAGYPVLLHGWNSHQNTHADVQQGCNRLGITVTADQAAAQQVLQTQGIAYVPLRAVSPALFDLLRLRDVLGLRSCINTVLRLLNPCAAPASVQGVFHPSYREVQMDACALLGQPGLSVIKGGGGEFECHPSKDITAFGLRNATPWSETFGATHSDLRRLAEGPQDPAHLAALWAGDHRDDFARSIVLSTTALALHTLNVPQPAKVAQTLWSNRNTAQAA
tara:strand:- start:2902 stop:3870 length:969 start_codon:yes stop_codon:yes gene_type:complete